MEEKSALVKDKEGEKQPTLINRFLRFHSLFMRIQTGSFAVGEDTWLFDDKRCRKDSWIYENQSDDVEKAVLYGDKRCLEEGILVVGRSDLEKAVLVEDRKKIGNLLHNPHYTLRDKYILQAVYSCVCFGKDEMLEFLFEDEYVINCVKAHPNLQSYGDETGDWGIAGKFFSATKYLLRDHDRPHGKVYENLLMHLLINHSLELNFPELHSGQYLRIFNILLKAKLYDINTPHVSVKQTEISRIKPSFKDRYERDDEVVYEYKIVKNSLFALACQYECPSALKSILDESDLIIDEEELKKYQAIAKEKILKEEVVTKTDSLRAKTYGLLEAYFPSEERKTSYT